MLAEVDLAQHVVLWLLLVLSLGVHEWAHAACALWLGDDTAKLLGRVTLNPLAHLDPVGSLLPLLGVPFGWAKPVPINPLRFRRVGMRTGLMLTAAAGPASNLAIVLLMAGVVFIAARIAAPVSGLNDQLVELTFTAMLLNTLLACFNLIPVPPLDGSRIAEVLMPEALRPAWSQLCSFGPGLLFAVILLPGLLGIDLFQYPREWATQLWVAALRAGLSN
jgi:Zn-dependent protease